MATHRIDIMGWSTSPRAMSKTLLACLLVLPMFAGECARTEVTWFDSQYFWIRVDAINEDAVVVVRGTLLDDVIQGDDRLYFVESFCHEWENWPDKYQCLQSRCVLSLEDGVVYTIFSWTEPLDRRDPSDRTMIIEHANWTCCE